MRRFSVEFRPLAETDLFALYRHIAKESGDLIAERYIARIEAACRSSTTFPERGTRRDDIAPGLGTVGFERRATIAFRIVGAKVVIVRIFYGGQEFERRLRGPRED